jgi:hypothetical protein
MIDMIPERTDDDRVWSDMWWSSVINKRNERGKRIWWFDDESTNRSEGQQQQSQVMWWMWVMVNDHKPHVKVEWINEARNQKDANSNDEWHHWPTGTDLFPSGSSSGANWARERTVRRMRNWTGVRHNGRPEYSPNWWPHPNQVDCSHNSDYSTDYNSDRYEPHMYLDHEGREVRWYHTAKYIVHVNESVYQTQMSW